MARRPSSEPIADSKPNPVSGDRVICVIARDVLSPDRQRGDFTEWMTSVWKERWLVLGFVLGLGLLATAYAFLAAEWYRAEVVLTPAPQKTTPGLASIGGAGLLAGLAGLNFGSTSTAESIGVLKSHDFARRFIEEQGLLYVLLSDEWDARAGRWKESNPKRQPDIRDAVMYFDKHVLIVDEDKRTGLVTVAIEWKSAAAAASWANMIVDRLNEQMRSRALAEGEANVAYLQRELSTTTVVPVQQAISRLLESELQKVMVARGAKQFSFRIVDNAEVPKRRSRPKRFVTIVLGILAGGLAGVGGVSMRQWFMRAPTAA